MKPDQDARTTMLNAVIRRAEARKGPLSRRLTEAMAESIRDGGLPPNRALPSEREMAELLGVSRSTVRICLKSLAQQGLVETRHGAGTVVVEQIPKALSRHSGFTEDAIARGLTPSSDVISRRIIPAETRAGPSPGGEALELVRLRRANGEALSFERVTVPVWAAGADFDGEGSLYARMAARGARPKRMLQTLEAVAAPEEIARLLGVAAGAPLLRIAQIGYGPDGRVVEDSLSWYRGDRYRYVGELEG